MSNEQDVRAVMEGVAEAFSRLDVDRWLGYFNPQHTFVHHDMVFVAQSLADTKAAFAPMIDELEIKRLQAVGPGSLQYSHPGAEDGDDRDVVAAPG